MFLPVNIKVVLDTGGVHRKKLQFEKRGKQNKDLTLHGLEFLTTTALASILLAYE
jgi:hypothetical protein